MSAMIQQQNQCGNDYTSNSYYYFSLDYLPDEKI